MHASLLPYPEPSVMHWPLFESSQYCRPVTTRKASVIGTGVLGVAVGMPEVGATVGAVGAAEGATVGAVGVAEGGNTTRGAPVHKKCMRGDRTARFLLLLLGGGQGSACIILKSGKC